MTDIIAAADREIRERWPDVRLLTDEPMSRHTSFRIGGPAPLLIIPSGPESLEGVCRIMDGLGLVPLLIGNGSDLLVEDAPLSFPVIQTHSGNETARLLPGDRIEAGCGITLARLACFARDNALTGLEFAHGIPGTLGGALFMNAGAYGGEMLQVTEETSVYAGGSVFTVTGEEHGFSYRKSRFSEKGGVALSSVLKLAPGDPAQISAAMEDLGSRRRASQPLEYPSAGSTFKRPKGAYAAALIDQCGLKGWTYGGARVSEKHAGFVISDGTACFDDVIAVMEHVQETVLRETGFSLEPEVRIIRASGIGA